MGFTRDVWMHRVDIARATGQTMVLTAEHDGRLVADLVAEWATTHGEPFTLELDGTAGGTYVSGTGGEHVQIDAVEFCRVALGTCAPAPACSPTHSRSDRPAPQRSPASRSSPASGSVVGLLARRAPRCTARGTRRCWRIPSAHNDLPSYTDPRGFATFAMTALAFVVFGWLIVRGTEIPRIVGQLALARGGVAAGRVLRPADRAEPEATRRSSGSRWCPVSSSIPPSTSPTAARCSPARPRTTTTTWICREARPAQDATSSAIGVAGR